MLASHVRLRGERIVKRQKPHDADDIRGRTRKIATQIKAISILHRILSEKGKPHALDLSIRLSAICSAMQSGVAGVAEYAVA
jgi:hypothetical protein